MIASVLDSGTDGASAKLTSQSPNRQRWTSAPPRSDHAEGIAGTIASVSRLVDPRLSLRRRGSDPPISPTGQRSATNTIISTLVGRTTLARMGACCSDQDAPDRTCPTPLGIGRRQVDPEACDPVVLVFLSRGFLNAFW